MPTGTAVEPAAGDGRTVPPLLVGTLLEHFAAQSPLVLFVLEVTTGRLVFVNETCRRITGRGPEELMAEPSCWLQVLHADDRPLVAQALAAVAAGGAQPDLEVRVVRPDGELRWVRTRVGLATPRGRSTYVAGVVEDVTEQKEVEALLRDANAVLELRVAERTRQLEATNRALQHATEHKDRFLAHLSHELRTPLNSMRGYTELVVDGHAGALNEEQRDFLQRALLSSGHLLQLVDRLLEVVDGARPQGAGRGSPGLPPACSPGPAPGPSDRAEPTLRRGV